MKQIKKSQIRITTVIFLLCCFAAGCKKQNEWLELKNNKSSVVPETLADFQAILDNSNPFVDSYTTIGQLQSDDFYLPDVKYLAAGETERNLYTWNKEIWGGSGGSTTWNDFFKIIELSNVVLDGLQKSKFEGTECNNIKGQALFHRASAYYVLAQLFCKEYTETAGTDLGLPVRLTSDVNITLQRSTLSVTYDQILNDLKQATDLLNASQPFIQRPSQAAAYALLAKTCLHMENYPAALAYATRAIELKPQLMDYNTASLVSLSNQFRFTTLAKGNPEILWYAESVAFIEACADPSAAGIVSPELYQLYETDDLRKTYLFAEENKVIKFRGTYTGNYTNFCGLAINETYLIRSECYARTGAPDKAMDDLNSLLLKRYKTGKYTPRLASNTQQALTMVLTERRKELAFTGNSRWEDLRRLNKELQFQKTLSRQVNGLSFTLTPNDKRYVLPIPLAEIRLVGLQQNDR
ncbi:RagB/SusD family nutrient uptake outer membrane protein [Pedobacter sp. MC2016-24]|uniref:RagB/SusD family nutrient uptake outer membrane protein n=1 Tax=Pedobacter sp. MC2016-24 TaxID=2780090 RepID=UPI00187FA3E7|nr:RagB/SusD family nutrient uptake outer membrane protein [Pedobacter sp. MC2016-24]MBE9598012.1 RagB/SusD family nutrient uptake outer membrane protein [Pedobacter sp. MC2016-24]